MIITIQTITDSAIDLADMRNSQFIDQTGIAGTELIRYANMAYKDLYAQIVLSKENYFTIPYPITVTTGQDTYSLPVDFYKLNGVDLILNNGVNPQILTLTNLQFLERNKYRAGIGIGYGNGFWGQVLKYLVVGTNIKFVPFPTQTSQIDLWYTPSPVTITSLNQTINIPIGGDEYMSLYIAAMCASKEESDPTPFNTKRVEVLDQMKNSLKDRDAGSPHCVVDADTINAGALYPFFGGGGYGGGGY